MAPRRAVDQIGFLLLPEFPIYALILATETLRIANQNSGWQLFGWHFFSHDGKPVRAGSGADIEVEAPLSSVSSIPLVIVLSGNKPVQYNNRRLLNPLRRLARHGTTLGAIDTGVFALAQAGLLDGFKVTLHWEAIPLFREAFPDIAVREQLYLFDRERLTCAGGMATLDMMLHLIRRRHGAALAQVVANGFVHGRVRQDSEQQRASAQRPTADADPQLMTVLRHMEENLETPLSPGELAEKAGISLRKLERLTRAKLGDTPMHYYLKVRLQEARNLLFYSNLPVGEIATACGFSAQSVFSRAFRAHFGMSPRDFRNQFRADQLMQFRPEIRPQMVLYPTEPPGAA